MRYITLLLLTFSALVFPSTVLAAAPTQTVGCEIISANYHRSLTNGDHINVTLSPYGQVNMYVDLNIAGGHNGMGLRWKILGAEKTPIPLTKAQVESGIINFSYGAHVSHESWTVSFVQTNSTDTWPNLPCSKQPPAPSCPQAGSVLPIGAAANGTLFTYTATPANWNSLQNKEVIVTVTGLTQAKVQLGLAAYKAAGPTWDTSLPQVLASSDVKTIEGCESIELKVTVPNCYWQVDFFTGDVLTGAQINNGERYGDHKVRWANGGDRECVSKTKLSIKKSSMRKKMRVGQGNTFIIRVKNTGNSTAVNTKTCDILPKAWKLFSTSPQAKVTKLKSGNKRLCWMTSSIGAGKTKTFKVRAKLVGQVAKTVQTSQGAEHVTVSKQESHVDLEPGETRTVTVSCGYGLASDGSVRVDHVDQGTGSLDDVIVHKSLAENNHEYVFTVSNNASGRAQAKAFVTCLPKATVQTSKKLTVRSHKPSVTKTIDGNNRTVSLTCPASTRPIAPGYEIITGNARLLEASAIGSRGWRLGFDGDADVKVQISCLADNARGLKLVFSHVERSITIAPGAIVSESVSCHDQAKGIVATHNLPPQLRLLGHDPRPKTRVFRIHNPTDSPATATIDLVCVDDRTRGKQIIHYRPWASNSATAKAANSKRTVRSSVKVRVSS